MMNPLITRNDVSAVREISANYRDERLNPFILEAQRINLCPLLGSALFYDFITNINDANYQDLLNGATYVNDKGETVQFFGVKLYLCYYVLAAISREGDVFHTSQNNAVYESEKFSSKSTKLIESNYKQNAEVQANSIIEFLNENKDTYPLWSEKSQGTTITDFFIL